MEEKDEKTMIVLLCTILALKDAYIRAIGELHHVGPGKFKFEHSRIELDLLQKLATVDGRPLKGCHFNMWQLTLDTGGFCECALAFLGGSSECVFLRLDTPKIREECLQFNDVGELLKDIRQLPEHQCKNALTEILIADTTALVVRC